MFALIFHACVERSGLDGTVLDGNESIEELLVWDSQMAESLCRHQYMV